MSLHTLHLIIVFALVVGVFVAFVREWLSPDLVALTALAVLLLSGTLSADETLKVFSNSAPVTIGCMFVLSAALQARSRRTSNEKPRRDAGLFCGLLPEARQPWAAAGSRSFHCFVETVK